MTVLDLRFFASVREAVGAGHERLATAADTAGALRAELRARGAVWADALDAARGVRVAIDQELADEGTPLAGAREVAFFPPVTGG